MGLRHPVALDLEFVYMDAKRGVGVCVGVFECVCVAAYETICLHVR